MAKIPVQELSIADAGGIINSLVFIFGTVSPNGLTIKIQNIYHALRDKAMKKFIKIIFIISIIFFLIGCKEFVREFVYELNSDKTGYILKEYNGSSENVIIPDSYNGLPITEIGDPAFYEKRHVTGDLIIPETITKIEDFAFSYTGFTKIVLSKNLKIIGKKAFLECKNLKSITFHDSIEEIKEGAFDGCSKLTGNLNIPKNLTKIEEETFKNTGYTGLTIPNNIKIIEEGAFAGANLAGHIIIPDSVIEIEDRAFYGTSAEKITISKSIKRIGNWTFAANNKLREVVIPEGVTEIGGAAFSLCHFLKSVTIPSTVTSIGNFAFGEDCNCLTKIICNAPNPPIIEDDTFHMVGFLAANSVKVSIRVPKYSISAYQKAPVWKEYKDIIISQ